MSTTSARKPTNELRRQLLALAPLFFFYHLGLLLAPRAANGVDFFTRSVAVVLAHSLWLYLLLLLALVFAYRAWLRSVPGRRFLDSRRLGLTLAEATVYAAIMGPLAALLLNRLHIIGPQLQNFGPFEKLVAAAGAGLYEELLFRLGGIWLVLRLALPPGASRARRLAATLLAVVLSSLVFSAAHHLGPGAEPFTWAAFAFRLALGVFLALVFLLRGIDTAAYSHFLYDVFVLLVWS